MNTAELVDRVSDDLREGVAVSVEIADPISYDNQWWRALGGDARFNAGIVANRLEQILPDDLREFRRIVRENSAIAPVNVIDADGRSSPALLYCIVESGHDLAEREYNHFFLGYPPVDSGVTEGARFYHLLSDAIQVFYSQIHDGFCVDIEFDEGGIPALEKIATWRDVTGYDSPDDLRQSLVGEEPYVPNPNQMAIVFDGGGDAVFVVMDHPKDNWQYAGGSFFYYPEVSRSGRRITPLVLIERAIVYGYLDYYLPMPFE